LLSAPTAKRRLADKTRCNVPEEKTHCWQAACDDDEVGFDETAERMYVSMCDMMGMRFLDLGKTCIQIPGMTIAHVWSMV
jgi:hypothetical protein